MRLSSNSSPRISFSRSSSRSFQDDFDETDFPCPFDVEYDEITDPSSRYGLKNSQISQCLFHFIYNRSIQSLYCF